MQRPLSFIIIFIITAGFCSCKQKQSFDDAFTLGKNDKAPYGAYAAYNLLQKEFPKAYIAPNKHAPGNWRALSDDSTGQVLLIITKLFNPSKNELDYLTGFVRKGNYVFVSAVAFSGEAAQFFKIKTAVSLSGYALQSKWYHPFNPFDTTIVHLSANSFIPQLTFQYPGVDFTNSFLKTDSSFAFSLGNSSQNLPNLIAINSGDGAFFLQTAPIVFTNFFLLYENNNEYFEKLMGLLPADTKKIAWDEYYLNKRNDKNNEESPGLLGVILKYENFRWALWVTILLLSFYILTEAGRRQRIIPVYTKPRNESLDFVTTVGNLYYEKGDHKNLAEKLTQYFLDYVRNYFKIPTTEINIAFEQQLAAKSGRDIEEIKKVTSFIHSIHLSSAITQKQLMDYYELLEKFYKKR